MKYRIIGICTLVCIALWISSCVSVKSASTSTTKDNTTSGLDSIFIDYQRTIPENIKYHIFHATKDGRSGWMNIEGDWIIPPEYDTDFRREWNEGVNICRKEGKYGAVNYKNEVVIPFIYNSPPNNCSDGLILVTDSMRQEAYYSKTGTQVCEFKKRQPEFRNGFAIITSNREKLAYYPRIDLETSKALTDIYTCDFIVVNTKFDTLLSFTNVPFLLEFGTLNNNRRTLFLYPYMAHHANLGIDYGQYGYVDGEGKLVIILQFRASDVFIPLRGFVQEPDCPFYSNLSKVRELDYYYFIDTLGNKVFELHTDRERLYNVGHFNNYGVAGYRTWGTSTNGINPSPSMIHLIDNTGRVVYEAFESDASLSYVAGNVSSQPGNDLIPIYDKKNGVHRIYTPRFEPFAFFPLIDSSKTITYQYRRLVGKKLNDKFILTQFQSSKQLPYPGSRKRLIDENQNVRSSWFPLNSILSSTFGNFSLLDTIKQSITLYDFEKNNIYTCDSCFIASHHKLRYEGVYKFYLPNKIQRFVNYRGKVLSNLFDTMDEKIYDLTEQIKIFEDNTHLTLSLDEAEIETLFEQSIMNKRIIR